MGEKKVTQNSITNKISKCRNSLNDLSLRKTVLEWSWVSTKLRMSVTNEQCGRRWKMFRFQRQLATVEKLML